MTPKNGHKGTFNSEFDTFIVLDIPGAIWAVFGRYKQSVPRNRDKSEKNWVKIKIYPKWDQFLETGPKMPFVWSKYPVILFKIKGG